MNIPVSAYLDLLATYLRPQWPKVLGLAGLLLSSIGLQLLSPQVIRYFIDTVQTGGAQRTLLLAALFFFVVVIVQRAVALATTYASETVAWLATNHLRSDLTHHLLQLDLAFHNAHTPGELLERIDGDVDQLANFFSTFVLQILSSLLLLTGVLVLLWREDWRLGLTLALFALLYMMIHTRGQQLAVPAWRRERQLSANLDGFIGERLSGIKDIQTSGGVAYVIQQFIAQLRQVILTHTKADVLTDIGWTISKISFGLGTVAAMGLGAYLYYTHLITIGAVYLVINYLALINRPLNRIGSEIENLQQARVSIERVKALLDTRATLATAESGSRKDAKAQRKAEGTLGQEMAREDWSARGLALTFEQVSFGYQADTFVLHDISFHVPAGRVLGLLGRTGSGKTTLSRLIFRLYEVETGAICVNGCDIRQLDLQALRRGIGLVTQEVQLFQASVRDNLTLFDEAISDETILAALDTLGLTNWLYALPTGLDTPLAGNGQGLSAGEAQLLALTRVFLRDPGLIILDEASSRLDPATEQQLEEAITRLLHNRTAIIIAHRLATVQRADEIIILEEGRIKEQGAYQQLAAMPDSIFANLLQTGREEVFA